MTETLLRTARFEDHPAGTELLRRLGLAMPRGDAEILAHWQRLWRDNPAGQSDRPMPHLGWVLEHGGRMVGFFANIAGLYGLGERTVMAAIASQWGVEKEFRGDTRRLADAYFAQPHADLILVTTAIKPTGRIFLGHGGAQAPQPGLDRVAFWIFDAGGFLEAAARKKNLPAPALARLAAPLLAALAALRRSARAGGAVSVAGMEAFDGRFDALWRAKRAERPARLLAWRDGASLRWHFAPHAARGGLRVLTLAAGRELAGYAVTAPEPAEAIGLKRTKILDLLARDDDPALVAALLAKAVEVARSDGAHVLEAGYVAAPHRAALDAQRPFARRLPTWPCFWKANDDALAGLLRDPSAWHVTPFDGDTALF